jgi:hypothetical protein
MLHFSIFYIYIHSLGDLTVSGSSSKFGVTEGNSEAVLPNLEEALRPTYVSTEHLDSKFEKHRYLLYVNLDRQRERERERERENCLKSLRSLYLICAVITS